MEAPDLNLRDLCLNTARTYRRFLFHILLVSLLHFFFRLLNVAFCILFTHDVFTREKKSVVVNQYITEKAGQMLICSLFDLILQH